jgi:23S rRNA (guanine2445-N2)-methyltransferase / 23S rRNA (guanine2069-N7)-methyltransferase
MAASPGCHLITEEGLLFEVEFTRLLDTGIFLDHRLTRSMLRQRAAGLDCLNLFAYTGTASVHMAAGHARSVTTLDLSNNYINWAQRNMQLNGFIGQNYDYQQADALRWVEEHRHDSQKYGLIFADPPTFSNSARMGRRSFDVQRDHAELVIALTRMLAQDGTVIFSCNLRGFKLDLPTLEKAKVGVTDISARTIPQDFERNQRIHHCFLATRLR